MSSSTSSRPGLWRSLGDALRGVDHDHTAGDLSRSILLLAVPMALELAMESVFTVCDIFFVARLGADAVAAVGLTEALVTTLYALAIGISMSTTALVARRIGEKNRTAAAQAGMQSIYLCLALGVGIGIPGGLFAEHLLRFMHASPEALREGAGYTRVMFASNGVILLLFVNNAIFRGAGNAVIAMRSLWVANAANLVLDPCLIFGLGPFPEMGVTGAAVATSLGRGIGVLYQFAALRSGRGLIVLRGPSLRLRLPLLVRLVRLSVGGVGQYLIATASWAVLVRLVAPFGSSAVAGYTIAVRILMFPFLPSWGISNAAATLVGQNLGAKQPLRAERSVWLTGVYNSAYLALVTLVCVTLAPELVAIFTTVPEIAGVAEDALRIISYGYIFYAWGMVLTQAFNGAGDTLTPTWLNLCCFWAGEIPLAWILTRHLSAGPPGVFWSVMTAETLLSVAAFLVFRRGRWKETIV